MELLQLRRFVAVAEQRNISKAARELSVSQPALSRSVHSLEEEVGVALFERTSQGLELTKAGSVLLRQAREILALETRALQEMISVANEDYTIQMIVRCIEKFLVDIIHEYSILYPQMNFSILQNDDIALQKQQFDLIIAGPLSDETGFTRHKLLTERILCALPETHPFAAQEKLSLEQFRSFSLIQFGGRRQIQWFMKYQLLERGLDLTPQFICDDVRTGCNLVASGLGALLIPEYAVDIQINPNIRLLPVEGLEITRDAYLYHRANVRLSEQVENFSRFVMNYFRKLHVNADI